MIRLVPIARKLHPVGQAPRQVTNEGVRGVTVAAANIVACWA
jgi:hypothetical protein